MKEDPPWQETMCPYCGERMHYTQFDRHKHLVHASVIEAEEFLAHPTKSEWRAIFRLTAAWFSALVLILLAQFYTGFDAPWFGWLIMVIVAAIIPGLLLIWILTPKEIKEQRKKAMELLSGQEFKCEICDEKVPISKMMKHYRKYHPKQVPYEYFRIATLVVFIMSFLGGMLALFVLAENKNMRDLFGVGVAVWITFNALFIAWVFYMSQVGEMKHIKRMREQWESERYDPQYSDKTSKPARRE